MTKLNTSIIFNLDEKYKKGTMRTISVQQTRDNLATLIETTALTGERFVVTKFGKPKAVIVPLEYVFEKKNTQKREKLFANLGELWKDRKDMDDSVSWVKKQRQQRKKNNEAISS